MKRVTSRGQRKYFYQGHIYYLFRNTTIYNFNRLKVKISVKMLSYHLLTCNKKN